MQHVKNYCINKSTLHTVPQRCLEWIADEAIALIHANLNVPDCSIPQRDTLSGFNDHHDPIHEPSCYWSQDMLCHHLLDIGKNPSVITDTL